MLPIFKREKDFFFFFNPLDTEEVRDGRPSGAVFSLVGFEYNPEKKKYYFFSKKGFEWGKRRENKGGDVEVDLLGEEEMEF